MDQIELANLADRQAFEKLESRVIQSGKDLIMHMRFSGEIMEGFALHDFPCDEQPCCVSIAVNCRQSGKVPVRLVKPSDDASKHEIRFDGFKYHNTWKLLAPHGRDALGNPRLRVEIEPVNDFPYLNGYFCIRRYPLFHLTNVSLPMACFSALSFVQFSLPASDIADRVNIALTLLLTAAAYKFVASSLTPPVSYLTALDVHASLNALLLVLLTLGGIAAGLLAGDDDAEDEDGAEALRRGLRHKTNGPSESDLPRDGSVRLRTAIDRCVFALFFAAWLFIQGQALLWLRNRVARPSESRESAKGAML